MESRNRAIIIGALLVALLIVSGCTKSKHEAATPPAPKIVSAQIVDTQTGNAVANATLSLSGATAFQNGKGETITTLQSSSSGYVTFYVGDNPTPAKINLMVTATNYLATTKTVTMNTNGLTDVTISLMNKTTASSTPGVELTTTNVPAAGATVAAMEAPQSGASVTVPASSSFVDTSGTPLAGPLNVSVMYVSQDSTAGIEAAPSLAATSIDFGGGMTLNGSLTTVAMLDIKVTDSSGKEASSLATNASVPLTISLPDSTINPLTGVPIKSGDQLQVFKFDAAADKWVFQDVVTVSGGPGSYSILYTVRQL